MGYEIHSNYICTWQIILSVDECTAEHPELTEKVGAEIFDREHEVVVQIHRCTKCWKK